MRDPVQHQGPPRQVRPGFGSRVLRGLRPARPGRARLGMTLEPLLCSTALYRAEYMIGTEWFRYGWLVGPPEHGTRKLPPAIQNSIGSHCAIQYDIKVHLVRCLWTLKPQLFPPTSYGNRIKLTLPERFPHMTNKQLQERT